MKIVWLAIVVFISLWACGGSEEAPAAAPAVPQSEPSSLEPGAVFEVTRSTGMEGDILFQGQRFDLRFSQQVVFKEEVKKVAGGRAAEVLRTFSKAERRNYNPETGRTDRETLAQPGSVYRVTFEDEEAYLFDGKSHEEIWDEDRLDTLSPPVSPALWPEGKLAVGQSWSYRGSDLTRRATILDARGGSAALTVERLEEEPSTGLLTAYIRGTISTKINNDPSLLDLDGTVEIDLPVELGVPLRIKIGGTLKGKGQEQGVTYDINANGSLLQICRPSAAVPAETKVKPAAQPAVKQTTTGDYLRFTRVTEPNERAFTLLVPHGWITEGGIFSVDPLKAGGPSNSIASKCDFTLKRDRPGTVQLRFLPDWNYAHGQGVVGLFPPGSNYQGMTVAPIRQAVQFLEETFHRERPQAKNVRVVERKGLPEIVQACHKLAQTLNNNFRAVGLPPIGFDAGRIVVEYTEAGTDFREELAGIIVDLTGSALMWSNTRTYLFRAPKDEFARQRQALSISFNSVEIDPNWLARALRGQDQRAQTVIKTMQQIQQIDREIAANRSRTQDRIQHEGYLTLMGQEDFVNPHTGEMERGTNQYDRRWVDRDGNVIYTDDVNFDPNRFFDDAEGFELSKIKAR